MAEKLNSLLLTKLPPNVAGPGYDRAALTPGIIHIGVGNFHRAHQAVYLDRLFQTGADHDWGIIGAGVKPYDEAMRNKLEAQDWLTTIVELHPKGLSANICGSMIEFIEVNNSLLIERLSHPDIRIVSLTVTEGGYFIDATTGGFDVGHPEIAGDISSLGTPVTVFGIMIAALRLRRDQGLKPFTVMSCDNLPENGHVARNTVIGLATAQDKDFGAWIAANVAFPNGMVDCITPATSKREIEMVADKFGIDDASPVACEPFRQWVLEDNFPTGRPALENVGVEFVADVAPYELMKLRILNGGHAAIAYAAALLGHRFVHDAMADPLISGFLNRLEIEEIIPTIPKIDGVSFDAYFDKVKERFSNEAIGDTIPRLCLDGSNRQPKFILPTIVDRLACNQTIEGLALEVALWCRYCAGTDEAGNAIIIDDAAAPRLRSCALEAKSRPKTWLEMTDVFGELAKNDLFTHAFEEAINRLWRDGTSSALQSYVLGAASDAEIKTA